MVVGAGRGPLVRASLRAALLADRKVRVYAVEKNPNAVITLRNAQLSEWGSQVTVVSSDMRLWKAPEKADILVSELLGSFGDNELSPECLDGAQAFLKPDGISIPCDSTSYISPISSSKLWSDVKAFDKYQEQKQFETSYVVKMHRFHEMAPAQKCFYFIHPNTATYPPLSHKMEADQQTEGDIKKSVPTTTTTTTTTTGKKVSRAPSTQKTSGGKASKRQRGGDDEYEEKEKKNIPLSFSSSSSLSPTSVGALGYGEKTIDNNRYTTMNFTIQTANILYGFAGYFESSLYKDISISIYPPTYSTGMFSWFPLYFPIQNPVYIPKNAKIKVHFWRNVSEEQHKVWYEWSFEDVNRSSGLGSLIHNPNGRSSSIRF